MLVEVNLVDDFWFLMIGNIGACKICHCGEIQETVDQNYGLHLLERDSGK